MKTNWLIDSGLKVIESKTCSIFFFLRKFITKVVNWIMKKIFENVENYKLHISNKVTQFGGY